MITENLSTLKIHKLTQSQYDRELEAGRIDANALYLTPAEEFLPAVEDTTYKGCYYRTVNGAKEWINPPMLNQVEYRTTERYLGKPVYTMVFYISQIGANNYESTLVPSYYTITLIAATTNGNNNRILTDYIDGTGTAIKVVNEQDTVIKDVITIIKYVYNN